MQNYEKFIHGHNNKKLFFLFLVFAFWSSPSVSFGLPITVISYNYDLSLEFDSDERYSSIENYNYTGTGTGPGVRHSIILPEYFSNTNHPVATAEVNLFNLYVEGDNLECDHVYVAVAAEWDFIPNDDHLNFNFHGDFITSFGGSGGWSKVSYSLTNITNNNLLLNESTSFIAPTDHNDPLYQDPATHSFMESYTNNLSQNDTYRLKLFAYTDSSDNSNARISAGVHYVPEPTITLLWSTGLIVIAGISIRRRKK